MRKLLALVVVAAFMGQILFPTAAFAGELENAIAGSDSSYTLSDDYTVDSNFSAFGEKTNHTFSVGSDPAGTQHQINFDGHTGFQVAAGETLNLTDVNLYDESAALNVLTNNGTSNLQNIINNATIYNQSILNISGGTSENQNINNGTITQTIIDDEQTNVSGYFTNNGTISQSLVHIAETGNMTTALGAQYDVAETKNDGVLNLTSGANTHMIDFTYQGSEPSPEEAKGTTNILGDVSNTGQGAIAQAAINVQEGASLTSDLDNVMTLLLTNDGTINATGGGVSAEEIVGTGTFNIASGAEIDNSVNITQGTFALGENSTLHNFGTITAGTLNIASGAQISNPGQQTHEDHGQQVTVGPGQLNIGEGTNNGSIEGAQDQHGQWGYGNITLNGSFHNNGTIHTQSFSTTGDGALYTSLTNLTVEDNTILDNGAIIIQDQGTVENNYSITQSVWLYGHVKVDTGATVINNALIEQGDIETETGGTLTSDVNNLQAYRIHNFGTLNLTGEGNIGTPWLTGQDQTHSNSNGTVNILGDITIASGTQFNELSETNIAANATLTNHSSSSMSSDQVNLLDATSTLINDGTIITGTSSINNGLISYTSGTPAETPTAGTIYLRGTYTNNGEIYQQNVSFYGDDFYTNASAIHVANPFQLNSGNLHLTGDDLTFDISANTPQDSGKVILPESDMVNHASISNAVLNVGNGITFTNDGTINAYLRNYGTLINNEDKTITINKGNFDNIKLFK